MPAGTPRDLPLMILFLLLSLFSFEAVCAIKWLSLAHHEVGVSCGNASGLSRRQMRVCSRGAELMEGVGAGARLALRECQWQFRYSPWNCSDVLDKNHLRPGTRESAFVHAISSAGVSHAVTRACSSGALARCGCDRSVPAGGPSFQWAGCSDNVAFGTAFAKSFVDDVRRRAKTRAVVNLRNNEAGRKAVEYGMRVECKCHGASGSCQTRTCWRALPDFRAVGAALRLRFDSARRLDSADGGGPLADTDLVYLRPSPDACGATRGRECPAPPVCRRLCCADGAESRFAAQRVAAAERCGCKFHWCCHVTCKQCQTERTEYHCL